MAAFSFAYNPFVILPVSLRASSREVEEAYQRRLAAKPETETSLKRARQLLLDPDSRLAAEVSWLIDVGPREAVTLLGAMASGNQTQLLTALENQPALSKANVAADACGRLRSMALVPPLAAAHRALDVQALLGLINDIHGAIPIAPVSTRKVEAAFGAITMLHAGAALEALAAQTDPQAAFDALASGPNGAGSAFMTELASQFRRRFPPAPPSIVEETAPAEASEPTPMAAANDSAEALPMAAPATIEPANDVVADPAAEPIQAHGDFAFAAAHGFDPHADSAGWGQGPEAHAAAASAFMDAQLVFSAHERFDTYGNARKVRRVLYVMGGGLAAMIVVWLAISKGPPDSDNTNTVVAAAPNYANLPRGAAVERHRHAKKQCIVVSGAPYCTD